MDRITRVIGVDVLQIGEAKQDYELFSFLPFVCRPPSVLGPHRNVLKCSSCSVSSRLGGHQGCLRRCGRTRSGAPTRLANGVRAYQRLRRKPSPPPAPLRSAFGRASLMFSALPSTVAPFNAAIAFSPSPSLSISTNPKPRGCPVSRQPRCGLHEGLRS